MMMMLLMMIMIIRMIAILLLVLLLVLAFLVPSPGLVPVPVPVPVLVPVRFRFRSGSGSGPVPVRFRFRSGSGSGSGSGWGRWVVSLGGEWSGERVVGPLFSDASCISPKEVSARGPKRENAPAKRGKTIPGKNVLSGLGSPNIRPGSLLIKIKVRHFFLLETFCT